MLLILRMITRHQLAGADLGAEVTEEIGVAVSAVLAENLLADHEDADRHQCEADKQQAEEQRGFFQCDLFEGSGQQR